MATSKQVTSIQTRVRNAVKLDQACPNYVFKYQRVHIALHIPLEFELDFDKPFVTVAIYSWLKYFTLHRESTVKPYKHYQ